MNKERVSRRSAERYSCDMFVWLRPKGSEEEFQIGQVDNVSSGGILCITNFPYESGTLLEVQISLLHDEKMVQVIAETRHLRKLEEDLYALGLLFIEVENMSLHGFMASLEAMFS